MIAAVVRSSSRMPGPTERALVADHHHIAGQTDSPARMASRPLSSLSNTRLLRPVMVVVLKCR